MFRNRSKEPPSVASTRVLKTHRMNSVETFRLQEKVKSIIDESKQNYSQISDEIDGVRQNLVKIKRVKNNVGVSVERRKLLRDKGLRILPLKGTENNDYFTVRNSVGKDTIIPCADFYNGDFLRKQLYIDDLQPEPTQFNVENFEAEDNFHDLPLEKRPNSCFGKTKEFRYRKITPPLRPGSRRNFQNVEDENSDDERKLVPFENLNSIKKTYGLPRPQTAYSRREVTQHPRSRPYSSIHPQSATPTRKTSNADLELTRHWRERIRSREDYFPLITTKSDDNPEYLEKREAEEVNETCVDMCETLEETAPSQSRPSLMAVASCTVDASIADRDIRGMGLDSVQEAFRLRHATASGKWCETEETSSNIGCAIASSQANEQSNDSNGIGITRTLLTSRNRNVSWKDGENHEAIPRDFGDKESDSCLLVNEQANIVSSTIEGRRQPSSNRTRPDMIRNETNLSVKIPKTSKQRSNQDFVYDARPGKALSKGYMTMQMTVGNKQVKVYVPKFSAECFDDVVERARAKSAAKVAGAGPGQRRLFVVGKK